MVFIDTLYVVALINQRDQFHARAEELAEQFEGQRFLVTDAVILEIGNALARNYKPEATRVVEHLLTSPDVGGIRLTAELLTEAFTLYKSHQDKEWGLTDCVSFIVMRQADVREALTFDQHFVQAGFEALMR
jgi:predicted nucleic acid-binding protein